MDLHLVATEPTAAERSAVDAVLDGVVPAAAGTELQDAARSGRVELGGARARRGVRHQLLPALHGVQDAIGWISPTALDYICRRLAVPPAEAYGVATFYALLATEERPPRVAHVCDDIVCRNAGAAEICRRLEQRLGPAHEAAGASHSPPPAAGGARATWMTSPCLGLCEHAPAVLLQLAGDRDAALAPAGADEVCAALAPGDGGAAGPAPAAEAVPAPPPAAVRSSAPQTDRAATAAELTLLRRVGTVAPESLDDYRRHGGYAALRRAFELGPEGVLRELDESRLVGRGGCGVPYRYQVAGGGPCRGAPPLRRVQRRRVGTGHLQGPGNHGAGPVRGAGGA